MSEEYNGNGSLSAQEELLRRLKSIGVDLWGNGPSREDQEKAVEAVEKDFAAVGAENTLGDPGKTVGRKAEKVNAAASPQQTPEKKAETAKKAFSRPKMTIENLWMTADETIDWTEAMIHDTSRDGLTPRKLWSFYHRIAPRVLAGETEAYAEVLTTLNPLGDLTEFVSGMVLRTPNADRVECEFECQPEDLEKYGRDYLGALSLRIARDLLAALPVEEVGICGRQEGEEKINVTFRRSQLLKQKLAFLNPADFAEACGGTLRHA